MSSSNECGNEFNDKDLQDHEEGLSFDYSDFKVVSAVTAVLNAEKYD